MAFFRIEEKALCLSLSASSFAVCGHEHGNGCSTGKKGKRAEGTCKNTAMYGFFHRHLLEIVSSRDTAIYEQTEQVAQARLVVVGQLICCPPSQQQTTPESNRLF